MTLRRITQDDPNNLRPGQVLFNALLDIDPAFAERIRGTELDPFHMDERVPLALSAWRLHLVTETHRGIKDQEKRHECLDCLGKGA